MRSVFQSTLRNAFRQQAKCSASGSVCSVSSAWPVPVKLGPNPDGLLPLFFAATSPRCQDYRSPPEFHALDAPPPDGTRRVRNALQNGLNPCKAVGSVRFGRRANRSTPVSAAAVQIRRKLKFARTSLLSSAHHLQPTRPHATSRPHALHAPFRLTTILTMRSLSLLPVLAAVATILPASAVPIEISTLIADQTVVLLGPTFIPNPIMPTARPVSTKIPTRRANLAHPIQARQVHNADFSASPNTTIPGTSDSAPAAPAEKRSKEHKHHHHSDKKHTQGKAVMGKESTESTDILLRVVKGGPITGGTSKDLSHAEDTAHVPVQRRAEGHNHEGKHGDKHESKHKSQQHSTGDAPSGPASLTSGLASGVKKVGSAPKQLSKITDGLPVAPDTPVTTPDAPATGSGAGQVPVPQPAPENEVPVGSGSYPTEVGYSYSAPTPGVSTASTNQKRHNLELDSRPITGATSNDDPKVGVINMDSNRKPEDTKEAAPKKGNVALAGTDTATAPTATATHSSTTFAEPTPTYKEVA